MWRQGTQLKKTPTSTQHDVTSRLFGEINRPCQLHIYERLPGRTFPVSQCLRELRPSCSCLDKITRWPRAVEHGGKGESGGTYLFLGTPRRRRKIKLSFNKWLCCFQRKRLFLRGERWSQQNLCLPEVGETTYSLENKTIIGCSFICPEPPNAATCHH